MTGFNLINANTNQPVSGFEPIQDGAQIDINNLPNAPLSIQALTNPNQVGSVRLQISGPINSARTENIVPYALFGDNNGNFVGQTFAPGNYTITATPFSAINGGGESGQALTISFSIVDSPDPLPEVTAIQLIDAASDQVLFTLSDGQEIDINSLPTNFLSAEALVNNLTESVRLEISGIINNTQTENIVPYSLFGDNPPGNFFGRNFEAGAYSLKATPYSENGLKGTKGSTVTINFRLVSSNLPLVNSATLIRPDVGSGNNPDPEIRELTENAVIDLAAEGGSISIRANASMANTESIRFILKDSQGNILTNRVENILPYALLGDNPTGDYTAFVPASGSYELTMIPYTEDLGQGNAGTALVRNFTVINGSSARSGQLSTYGDEAIEQSEGEAEVINVSPNPMINNELNIQFNQTLGSEVIYRVYDAQGRTLIQGSETVLGEWMRLQFQEGQLANSTYFLQLLGKGLKQTSIRLVKQ